MIESGKAGEAAGFKPWTGSTNAQISDAEVKNYGLAMGVYTAHGTTPTTGTHTWDSDKNPSGSGAEDKAPEPPTSLCSKTLERDKVVCSWKQEDSEAYEEAFLFTWSDGVPFEPDFLYHHFKKIMTKYGKPQFTLHSLRHSCASFLYEMGWRESEIADWLGNSNETMKEWYLVIDRNHNKEKAESLSGVLKI